MKKTIKLTESKLVEMINNIVSEQQQQKLIGGIVNRFKKTISEQTQDFPGDDDAQMMSFIDNELLDFGFKK